MSLPASTPSRRRMVNKEDRRMNLHPQASTIIATKAEDQGGGQKAHKCNSSCNNVGDSRQTTSRPPSFGLEAFEKGFVEVGRTTQEGSFPWVGPTHHSM